MKRFQFHKNKKNKLLYVQESFIVVFRYTDRNLGEVLESILKMNFDLDLFNTRPEIEKEVFNFKKKY